MNSVQIYFAARITHAARFQTSTRHITNMHPSELFNQLKRHHGLKSDSDIARLIGLTPSRISQMSLRDHPLTARQITSYIAKAEERGKLLAYNEPIRPIVEMYPVERVLSRQDRKWELLPTRKQDSRNQAIREHLENSKGIYLLYDSQGCAIYAGKTEKQNIWKEMTSAFNRERSNHQKFIVVHPKNGKTFSPAWKTPRQPQKRLAYLHNTASFFPLTKLCPR